MKTLPIKNIIFVMLVVSCFIDSEKYKRLEAVYLGSRFVTSPHGIRVVNESVQYLSRDKSKWIPVFVDVASSHIRILDKKVSLSEGSGLRDYS